MHSSESGNEGEFVRNGPRGWTKHRLDMSDRPIKLGDHVISRRRLAKLCGVSPSHIGLVFKGRRHPSVPLAIKIASEFGVTLDELFIFLRDRVDEYLKSIGVENGYLGAGGKVKRVEPINVGELFDEFMSGE